MRFSAMRFSTNVFERLLRKLRKGVTFLPHPVVPTKEENRSSDY